MPIDNSKYTLLLIVSSFSDPEKITGILEEAGFRILKAQDQQEAIRIVAANPPDMIILDTDQSGFSLIRELQPNKTEIPVPLLLITSMSNEVDMQEYVSSDNVDFMLKPLHSQELVFRIQHQLSLLHTERIIRKQNIRLRQTIESRDKLYSVIAHDLRAPIGTIKMINSSLESQKDKIKDPSILKLFEMINETTEEAFNLLENLLRWSRNQNGKTKVYSTNFNISNTIRQVMSLFSTIASTKDITLNNYVQGTHDIHADEDMIKTVLRNLLSNAIKFTYAGGKVDVTLSETKDSVLICVKDNGKGIPKKIQEHLLESDEYITTYGTHNEKGSGLGLILCNDFIRMNKGKFSFFSQEGVGSTFYFTVPKAPVPVHTPAESR